MLRRFIYFLVRKRLGLKKYEKFQFVGQKSPTDYYYFTETRLRKNELRDPHHEEVSDSGVSLNWLLDENCRIRKVNASVYRP